MTIQIETQTQTLENTNIETLVKPKRGYIKKKDRNDNDVEVKKRNYTVKPKGMSEQEEIKYYKERKAIANLAYQQNHVSVIRACQNRYFQKEGVQEKIKLQRENKKIEIKALKDSKKLSIDA